MTTLQIEIQYSESVNLRALAFATEEGKRLKTRLDTIEIKKVTALCQRDSVWSELNNVILPNDHPYWTSREFQLLQDIHQEERDIWAQLDVLGGLTYAQTNAVEPLQENRAPIGIPLPTDGAGIVAALRETIGRVTELQAHYGPSIDFHLTVED